MISLNVHKYCNLYIKNTPFSIQKREMNISFTFNFWFIISIFVTYRENVIALGYKYRDIPVIEIRELTTLI